jgi:Protein of unknown function DUF47
LAKNIDALYKLETSSCLKGSAEAFFVALCYKRGMFRKFLPRRDVFFVFFEKHATISFEAAKQLVHYLASEQKPAEVFQKIKNFENEADTVTHQCIETLHKTFITPMDRMEIYRLIATLDDITDEIEDTAKLIFLYKLRRRFFLCPCCFLWSHGSASLEYFHLVAWPSHKLVTCLNRWPRRSRHHLCGLANTEA